MRTIKQLHIPEYAPIADLVTYQIMEAYNDYRKGKFGVWKG